MTRPVEEALRASQELLRTVVASAPVVLFALDREGRFTLSEGRGLQALGLRPGEVVGQSVFDVYRDHPQIIESCRRALAGDDFIDITRLGELVFECRYVPQYDAQGAFTGSIGVAADITARHRAEAALRASDEQLRQLRKMDAIGRMAGGVAHDFNNILTAIVGYGEMLLKEVAGHRRLQAQVENILDAANRGTGLTRQLLGFSRKQPVALRAIDLAATVADACQLLRRLIGEDVALDLRTGPGRHVVVADPVQIEQVVINLAVNARDAMPDGGRLDIVLSRRQLTTGELPVTAGGELGVPPGDYVVLSVADNGSGMDLDVLEHLFEPFFTTKQRGTGLGLSTVYGIVKQHAGHIRVDSARGRGTTFIIYLPSDARPLLPVDAPVPDAAPVRASGVALVVEDEEAVRGLTVRALAEHGFTVFEARDGLEALAVAEGLPAIDLLVTDMVMPRLGGRELADRLLLQRPGLRVLLMSGYTGDARVLSGEHDARSAFLQKPFTPDRLVRAALALLAR